MCVGTAFVVEPFSSAVRLLLGAAATGYFPGVILYLSTASTPSIAAASSRSSWWRFRSRAFRLTDFGCLASTQRPARLSRSAMDVHARGAPGRHARDRGLLPVRPVEVARLNEEQRRWPAGWSARENSSPKAKVGHLSPGRPFPKTSWPVRWSTRAPPCAGHCLVPAAADHQILRRTSRRGR